MIDVRDWGLFTGGKQLPLRVCVVSAVIILVEGRESGG